ncbi:MAG: thioredoxin family protein [Bacteroidetes bacterium]|nr:thioredoxin family protein [Bacteroidota bacterium]MDA1269182.1 thioredoxin family protein [Bacteroidota bacterium]
MKSLRYPITSKLLDGGYFYPEFVEFTKRLVQENRTTGDNQSEEYLAYTSMSLQRMLKWNKTSKVSEALELLIQQVNRPQVWLVITETWCGDGAQSIPHLAKLVDLHPNITLKIILRDEHPDLMDAYLTQGSRSIPKLVAMTADLQNELFTWGPKPKHLIEWHRAFKQNKEGYSYSEFLKEAHLWYAKNKQKDLESEIYPLISSTLIP